jgi:2-iminobutanoate/2-iminopropanoate deaminase
VVRESIATAEAPCVAGPYSPGLRVGEWIFLAGQGGVDPKTDRLIGETVAEQVEQTFRNIEALLRAAGASLSDIVSCQVHLVDLADFAMFNEAYARQFPGDMKPVRTTVRADLLADMRVEVTTIAHRVVSNDA